MENLCSFRSGHPSDRCQTVINEWHSLQQKNIVDSCYIVIWRSCSRLGHLGFGGWALILRYSMSLNRYLKTRSVKAHVNFPSLEIYSFLLTSLLNKKERPNLGQTERQRKQTWTEHGRSDSCCLGHSSYPRFLNGR